MGDFLFMCLGGESHTRPVPLQGNALLLSYLGIYNFQIKLFYLKFFSALLTLP